MQMGEAVYLLSSQEERTRKRSLVSSQKAHSGPRRVKPRLDEECSCSAPTFLPMIYASRPGDPIESIYSSDFFKGARCLPFRLQTPDRDPSPRSGSVRVVAVAPFTSSHASSPFNSEAMISFAAE